MKISDLMTTHVITCRPTDTLEYAANLMSRHDLGWLVAVDHNGCPVGTITDRDISLAALDRRCVLAEILVGFAMSPRVFTALAKDEIVTVARAMASQQVGRMVVTDAAGRLTGVITLSDLARAWRRAEVPAFDLAFTLAAISEPPHAPPLAAAS